MSLPLLANNNVMQWRLLREDSCPWLPKSPFNVRLFRLFVPWRNVTLAKSFVQIFSLSLSLFHSLVGSRITRIWHCPWLRASRLLASPSRARRRRRIHRRRRKHCPSRNGGWRRTARGGGNAYVISSCFWFFVSSHYKKPIGILMWLLVVLFVFFFLHRELVAPRNARVWYWPWLGLDRKCQQQGCVDEEWTTPLSLSR